MVAAKAGLQKQAEALADQIIQSILKGRQPPLEDNSVVSRIRPVLALALFILLVSAVRVTPIHAQQPKEGAGAAQPEPKEQNT